MSTTNQFIGRREAIGLGIESVNGTGVASQTWLRWLDQDFQNKTTVIENESAMGVVDAVNDSEVVNKFADGKIGGKLTALASGYIFTGFFGSPSTGAPTGGVYPHTFQMSQSSVPAPSLSITRVNPLETQRHTFGVIDALELSAEAGGWVELSATIKARAGITATDTPGLVAEKEFTSKHISVELAADTAGLAAASNLDASKATVTLERPSEMWPPLGDDTNVEFDRGEFRAKGELTIRYKDTQYETDFLANTVKALRITIANGSDASFEFTAGRIRYRELSKSTGRDGIVTQVLSWAAELDTATSRSIQLVLKNTQTAYVSA